MTSDTDGADGPGMRSRGSQEGDEVVLPDGKEHLTLGRIYCQTTDPRDRGSAGCLSGAADRSMQLIASGSNLPKCQA
jgi:hypothetical protein